MHYAVSKLRNPWARPTVHAFATREERDAYVNARGGELSAWAYGAITRGEARRILGKYDARPLVTHY